MILLPEQCRAARGLLNWTQAQLACSAGISRSTVRDFEGERHELHRGTEDRLIRALEAAGVALLPPGFEGPGVRLRCDRGASAASEAIPDQAERRTGGRAWGA
ncbi:helix-turn-helix domain-containing protein [Sphingomonas flavalba]|uniref:helix-turn-helix domain-containing protein n=1 Tax=Sphingomonas flavalba TaxID=2559804 RepID=UPI0039DF9FD8